MYKGLICLIHRHSRLLKLLFVLSVLKNELVKLVAMVRIPELFLDV